MASTPPVIFKRTKGKPAQRTRQTSPENEPRTGAAATRDESPSTLATKLKNKVKKRPKSRLSFGGDEDEESGGGEVFQVKKSNLSRKLALGTHPASVPLNLEQATISPNRGPTYDQAYLKELKASTPTSRPPDISDSYDADMSMDVEDVSMMSVDGTDVFGSSEAIIPTESSIKLVKERRERLRKTGTSVEEDFISLSVVRKSDVYQGPHPESRLMREEDELGEGDDEFADYTSAQERIALGKKSRKVEASKRRDALKEMIADVEGEEEDEESAEWEQEQLRRGGLVAGPSQPSHAKVKEAYKPSPIPSATAVPTLGPAMARLTERLTNLTTSHASNMAALNNLAKERAEVDDRETEMREMVGRAEDKRAWFEDLKDWVEGVAGFLDEKYPLLEKLEEEHISLLQEKFELIANRRSAEDEDDLSTVFGPLPAAPPPESDVEERDDIGRIIPKPTPAALKRERREARTRRRKIRLQQQHVKEVEEEGYSTDSALPPDDASAYSTALKSLALRTKDVLADVRAEEFRDPGKGRWSAWREKYADSYVGAWGGLGVVSVWEFWVRLETVGWDCIEDPRSLDSFRWYQGLYKYSRPGDEGEGELGSDGDLVASMISTAVIPRLSAIIAGGAFDPYSESHTRRAIHLAEEVEASVEQGNVKLQALLHSVVASFQSAISSTEALVAKFKAVRRGVPAFDPEAIPARRRFLARRVKLLRNILRWRKHSGERFGIGHLITRLVEGCILDIAESGWEVGGEDIARKVAAMLPNELITYEMKRRLGLR
ncbi:GC-rich sequence DNA-binding factor 2 [Hypsizygus marmoreus]|uniref:GC-rich sequence DNA-binding factor 2 n=1 Tax=Hypsizygus marmoreus TaxID=39966 RepID=A0A369JI12_HYPMA|nr:GC-rich sequence DNA-binding factor 2 [Hypsizygus marmoreus]